MATTLVDTAQGRLRHDGRNELQLDSKEADPPKLRIGSPITPGGGGGGVVGFDALEQPNDPNGRRVEMGIVMITQSEYSRASGHPTGKVSLNLTDGRLDGDAAEVRMVEGFVDAPPDQQALWLHPSWVESLRKMLGSVPAAPSAPAQTRFYSPNGRFCMNIQDDGHLVQYDTHNSTDESRWTAVWSNWHGLMKPLPW